MLLFHSQADAMQHEPCRLLSNADGLGDLVATDTVLAIGEHPDDNQPFIQGDRGILEYGSNLGRELALGVGALALPFVLTSKEAHIFASASGAGNDAIRPTLAGHVVQTILRVGKVLNGLLESLWFHRFASLTRQE